MMTEGSSYTAYLPPVLWADENDPQHFLARLLRIFERVLTGIPLRAEVVRAEGSRTSAAGNRVLMAAAVDAARFRAGDRILLVGTALERTVQQIDTLELILDAAVPALGPGTVRIADLAPAQTRLRLDNMRHIGPGTPVRISQGPARVEAIILAVDGESVSLSGGLGASFTMTPTAMPVVVSDGTTLQARGRDYTDLERTIDRLPDLFNPWRTPTGRVPWLASWVALPLHEGWSDYQRRWLTAEIAKIYRERGLKRGLLTYLDIYAPSAARPRIAVDDGDAAFRLEARPDGSFTLREAAHCATATHSGGTVTVLLHPRAVAFDAANRYLVADQGDLTLSIARPPALWRLTSTGEVPFAPGPPAPLPRALHVGAPLIVPTGLVVDTLDQISVVDIGNADIQNADDLFSHIVRFAPPAFSPVIVVDQGTTPNLAAVHPVDMVLDTAGRFIVLDRGLHPFGDPPQGPTNPAVVVVSEDPLAVTVHPLTGLVEPTAITLDSAGRFIVADARDQLTTTPADLVRVDPAAGFTQTSLLDGVAPGENPLVYPVGLAFEASGRLLVCDSGVRMGYVGDTRNRVMAENAAIYRVDLAQSPPTIVRVAGDRSLVAPTNLALDRDGAPIILDRGETLAGPPGRSWRARAHEFGVVLLFSEQRPTTFDERNAVRRGVFDVVNDQKPAHTTWWMDF
jgi:phage tail-like protein